MEALWTFFLPHFAYVLELVKSEKFGKIQSLEADFGFHRSYNTDSRLFKKELGGGSLLDIGIYPVFAALATLGEPEIIAANATFFENGADSSCEMVFQYKQAKATLKSTLLEETLSIAVFKFDKAIVKLNRQFHQSSTITILQDDREETIHFDFKTIGYNFEITHFNQLVIEGKKESNIMTFDFSRSLIKTLDNVREIIGLNYIT
jgi:predicted dehydrogenase